MINLSDVGAIVFDFDGVFTDNRVIICEDGKEYVVCNRSDGIGLELIRSIKIPMIIISSEKNSVVKMRAKKLKLEVKYGVVNKKIELKKFARKNNLNLSKIVYLGNDINDLDCMRIVGYPIAVFDAERKIRAISCLVLKNKGGKGAVRELCEIIYKDYRNG